MFFKKEPHSLKIKESMSIHFSNPILASVPTDFSFGQRGSSTHHTSPPPSPFVRQALENYGFTILTNNNSTSSTVSSSHVSGPVERIGVVNLLYHPNVNPYFASLQASSITLPSPTQIRPSSSSTSQNSPTRSSRSVSPAQYEELSQIYGFTPSLEYNVKKNNRGQNCMTL